MLGRWGYAAVGGIKTSKLKKRDDEDRSISKVEVVLKKNSDFEKIFEDYEKERLAKRDKRPRSRSEGGAKEKTQQPPKSSGVQEEVKQSTPKKLDEGQLQDGSSAEAPTSAKS